MGMPKVRMETCGMIMGNIWDQFCEKGGYGAAVITVKGRKVEWVGMLKAMDLNPKMKIYPGLMVR